MTRSLDELLEQTRIWRGQDGRVYYVGELDDEHLGAILAMLNRRAASLLEHRRWWDAHHGVDVGLGTGELGSVDALAWLHDRPLYRALLGEQRRRGAVDGEVISSVADVDAARRREVEARVAELRAAHDDLATRADEVAARPASVANDRALTDLGRLLEGYRDAIERLGEL